MAATAGRSPPWSPTKFSPEQRSVRGGPRPAFDPNGFYRFSLGGFEATVLNDGYFELPGDSFAVNAPAEARRAFYEARAMPLDKVRHQASPILINTGQRLVLVDTGLGPGTAMSPHADRLGQSLAAAGVAPEAIDMVVLTHAHPDHVGGLIDQATRAPRFPKAEVALSEAELGLWTDPDAATRVPGWATATPSLQLAQSSLAALRERLRPVRPSADMRGERTGKVRSRAHRRPEISRANAARTTDRLSPRF